MNKPFDAHSQKKRNRTLILTDKCVLIGKEGCGDNGEVITGTNWELGIRIAVDAPLD